MNYSKPSDKERIAALEKRCNALYDALWYGLTLSCEGGHGVESAPECATCEFVRRTMIAMGMEN